MRLASKVGAWTYHSSVMTGGVVGAAPVGLDPADQRLERAAGLATRLPPKQVPVLGVAAERAATMARQVARLDGQLRRLVGERIARQPPIGQIDGLAPAPLRHRLARGSAQGVVILAEQRAAGGRRPTRRTAGPSGPRTLPGSGECRRPRPAPAPASRSARKLGDVAVERRGQLDHRPVGPEHVAQRVPQVLERLPQGGARLDLGRLAPEQAGQRLPALRPPLELEDTPGGPWLWRRAGA